jgi:ABC-type transporter Mla maintaining outer membrane lipid asymmetry ATPase subunit MlaF
MNASTAIHPAALSAKGLVKRFKSGRNTIEILRSVDFDAMHGEVTMVMGPSGSGKSTLIAALSGLLRPDCGLVTALGEDLWSRRARWPWPPWPRSGWNPAPTNAPRRSPAAKNSGWP